MIPRCDRLLFFWFVCLSSLIATGATQAFAAEPAVNRMTDSAESDLISQLLSLGMLDTAVQVCELRRAEAKSGSDDAAKWLIEWARAKTAVMLRELPETSGVYITEVQREIDAFLINHSSHPRSFWLKLQRDLIDLANARRAVLMAVVKPVDDPSRDASLKQIVGLASRLQELSKEIETQIALERNKDLDSVMSRELTALAIVVATHRIDSLMLRGELFADGTADSIASANQSLAAVQPLLDSLPSGAEGRTPLSYRQVESLRRTGDWENAAKTATLLIEQNPDDVLARSLAARIAIDRGDLKEANRLLSIDRSIKGKRHLEVDLVRLQLEIETARADKSREESSQRIADSIQRIGKLHGDYARRRAERLVLGTSLAESADQIDPRIIIAQASSYLREGAPERAAEILAAASRSAENADAAIQLATAGAAAFQKAADLNAAADLLREASLAHFKHPEAANLHLQSALLLGKQSSADAIIEHLQEGIRTWPSAPSTSSACDWLIRLHQAKQEHLDAARVAITAASTWMTRDRIQQAKDLWIESLLVVPLLEQDAVVGEALEAFKALSESTEAKSALVTLVVLFGNRERLLLIDGASDELGWIDQLKGVRRGELASSRIETRGIDARLLTQAINRLILDGKTSRADRKKLGQTILNLAGDKPSLQVAQAYGWMNDWPRAQSIVQELLKQNAGDRGWVEQSATFLSESDDAQAKRLALSLWTSLSAQLKQGTEEWHRAKLGAIELMSELGDRKEAAKAASYILLTQPQLTPEIRERYQAYVE